MGTRRSWHCLAALVALAGILGLSLPTSPALAAPIPTRAALASPQAELAAVVDRAEVAEGLAALGISPEEARRRALGLTEGEARLALERLDSLPAAGSVGAVIGAALFVFVVLLITDILGFTSVFPFVKKTVR